jgi:hypothetical protein
MATLNIGGKRVKVSDDFLSLSPEEQQRTANEIAAQIGAAPAAAPMAPSLADSVDPPAGAKPGSREYADWAAARARAGKALPQVSPAPPEDATRGPLEKIAAFTASAAVPAALRRPHRVPPGCAPPQHGTGQDKGRKKSDVFGAKQ